MSANHEPSKNNTKTFFTSDTHFGHRLMALHRRSAPGAATKDDVSRQQVEDHDRRIIAAWNNTVGKNDVVWHLGDLTLKSSEEIADILRQLNGRVRLVLGNHDRAHPRFGERSVDEQKILLNSGIGYVCTEARITIGGTRNNRIPILLSHFPYARGEDAFALHAKFAQWIPRDMGEILLHGHTHAGEASQPGEPRQLHVGWDTWGRPVAEDEVLRLIRRVARGKSR